MRLAGTYWQRRRLAPLMPLSGLHRACSGQLSSAGTRAAEQPPHLGALPARKAAAARLVPLARAQDGLAVRVVPLEWKGRGKLLV